VKQVEIFAKIASHFGFPVPDDLKLRDLNTIAKLAEYIQSRAGAASAPQTKEKTVVESSDTLQAIDFIISLNEEDEFPDPASPIKRLIVRAMESQMPEFWQKDHCFP